MKLSILSFLLLFTLESFGQIDSKYDISLSEKNDIESQCDSTIKITTKGELGYKLIFKQSRLDISNRNSIIIPFTRTSIDDKSILFSNDKRLSKTILKIGYDTCEIQDYKEIDNKRNFTDFVSQPDTADINNWKIEITFQGTHCMDTDYHKVRISKNDSNYILFNCLHNIKAFELDLNNDNRKELYLISYIWCASEIRIYRIDEITAPNPAVLPTH